jgi:hypothetical protein
MRASTLHQQDAIRLCRLHLAPLHDRRHKLKIKSSAPPSCHICAASPRARCLRQSKCTFRTRPSKSPQFTTSACLIASSRQSPRYTRQFGPYTSTSSTISQPNTHRTPTWSWPSSAPACRSRSARSWRRSLPRELADLDWINQTPRIFGFGAVHEMDAALEIRSVADTDSQLI